MKTQIELEDGATHAMVTLAGDGDTKSSVRVPIPALLQLISSSVTGSVEEALEARAAVAATRVRDPLAWKVNLFPDLPYGLFEASVGGLEVAVRGFEAGNKILQWRPDSRRTEKPTPLAFWLPKHLWIVAWKGRRMVKAWLYTCDAFPTNVTDSGTRISPWGAGNVWEYGEVCWGSTNAPIFGTDGITAVAGTFFGSIFNDHIPNITLKPEFQTTRAFRNGFSLDGLHKQTASAEKVGRILHADTHHTNLAQVLSRAAGE